MPLTLLKLEFFHVSFLALSSMQFTCKDHTVVRHKPQFVTHRMKTIKCTLQTITQITNNQTIQKLSRQ